MNGHRQAAKRAWLAAIVVLGMTSAISRGAEHTLFVSPTGDDRAAGTQQAPFRTLDRAQEAVRALAENMRGDLVVSLAAGEYRLKRPLEFTEKDSGRNGFRVLYRSAAGPGKARLLGSVPLKGWLPFRDGIWKVDLPPKTVFHTLYENGKRVHKARWPDLEFDPLMPTALGRYLVTVDGSPKLSDKQQERPKGPGWFVYRPEDAPPVTTVTKMRIHIYAGGKCDWVREIYPVTSIDPQSGRLTFAAMPTFGVGEGARYFLEDELGFLNVPGEFFLDQPAHTLYYMPVGKGHPDTLGISYPVVNRIIQLQGKSREQSITRMVLDGLAMEETDDSPPTAAWAYDGQRDGALVWLNNAAGIEVRNCHLKNGGRSGIMMIGHNVDNRVSGCWIEHLGLNGVSLCNHFLAPNKKDPTTDRCENNRIYNTHISHVGELHTYAECVTVFNVSNNEVSHCMLDNSVRYAITLRGNTGEQYGPPVSTNFPPTKGNRFHHVCVTRCGQDGGDMGALHAANLNNPGGGYVNTFEQITVADTAAIASMKDIAPDGIFLDWPKMAMDQVFRNIHIIRSQGKQLRSHGLDNGASAVTENVSWKPDFRESLMDYEHIGLTPEFPAEYGGRPRGPAASAAPVHLRGQAISHDRVVLEWDTMSSLNPVEYLISCNGQEIGRASRPQWCDRYLKEGTAYHYFVAARSGDFSHFGQASQCTVTTPADLQPPTVTGVRVSSDGRRVRVAFSEPVEAASACNRSHYRFDPPIAIQTAKSTGSSTVELCVDGYQPKASYQLHAENITDTAAARNRMVRGQPAMVARFDVTVRYPLDTPAATCWPDTSGGGGHANLQGAAVLEAHAGPLGGTALVLDGKQGFAEAPNDLNLGPGDFTLSVWIYRENGGVIVSKGNGFGRADQWSFGDPKNGVPGSVSLRVNNHYFATAERSVRDREWTHLAFVRRGNQGASYVNGQPSGASHDLSGIGPLVNDRPLRIGRREYETNPMFFQGRVSGLTIWPRALNPQQIRAEASSGPAP